MADADDMPLSEVELECNSRAAAAGRVEAPSRNRRQSAAQAYRTYQRWLRLKRLAMAAFFTMAALFILWAIPWLPAGLETNDYTPELAFTTYLLLGVALTAAAAMTFQELVRRHREGMLAWGSIYDETTGLRNRAYLYDRLSLECELADHNTGVFSVLVLRVGVPALGNVAELVEQVTHRLDVVALLSGSELAILSVDVGEKERDVLLERLQGVVAAELHRLPGEPAIKDVRGGAATYGVDGTDPNALVQVARSAAKRGLVSRTQAA